MMDGGSWMVYLDFEASHVLLTPSTPLCSDSPLQVVLAGDTNQDGELDFEEFSRYLHTHEKQLRLLFSNLDRNHDGLSRHTHRSY